MSFWGMAGIIEWTCREFHPLIVKAWTLAWVLLTASFAWGQGKKPEEKAKSNNNKTVKDSANDALDSLDHGIHQALPAAKKTANKGLQAVDDGVHKVIGSSKDKK